MYVVATIWLHFAQIMEWLYEPLKYIGIALGWFTAICMWQENPYTIIGLFATRKYKPAKNNHKYAVLIPARNEEAVIPNLIASIKKQDYPSELITIFVIADNCTDNTAKIARECGAICYERFDNDHRTKGFALQFLFERIREDYGIDSFEGYFIFDSDNLLKKDYISRMNDSFDAGDKIITSYRATKNWNESWIASTYALHWLRSIRMHHRARSVLHLATNIQGTGFLFHNEIVLDGWKYTSLTEDRALTADCVVAGYEIAYNDDAIFYDEQPVSLKVALRQRTRWSKGHLLAFAESGWGLFKNIFVDKYSPHKEGDKWYNYPWRTIRHRFMAFDTFGQLVPRNIISLFRWLLISLLVSPFVQWCNGIGSYAGQESFIVSQGNWLCKFIRYIFDYLSVDLHVNVAPGPKAYLASMLIVLLARILMRISRYFMSILIAVYLFIVERKRVKNVSLPRKILYCFTWPTFDIIGRYSQYVALFKKVEWKPIPHNSKITIDDIQE